jgi:hypothetical protein
MGPLWAAPEEHAEALAPYMALPADLRRLVQRLDYQQTARNDFSYLGLQFFIARLHTDISLEVIKSNTADMYKAFLIAHNYETAVKSKKEKDSNCISLINSRINEMSMDAEFEDEERAEIEAISRKYQQKKMFKSNNGSAFQQHSNGGNCNGNSSNYNNGGNGNNRDGSYQQSGSGSGAPRKPNPPLGKTCHYCKKKNNFQSDCYKRKRDDAPLVKVQELDEDGHPKTVESIYNSKN